MVTERVGQLPWHTDEQTRMLARQLLASAKAGDLLTVDALLRSDPEYFSQRYSRVEDSHISLRNEVLYHAACTGNIALVAVFLKHGADLNQPRSVDDGEGVVSRIADEDQHHAMIRWLVDQGSEIMHIRNGNPVSRSLIVAAMGGAILNTRLFIERGAPVNGRARNGLTALDFAINDGRTEVAAYLRSVGARCASELRDA